MEDDDFSSDTEMVKHQYSDMAFFIIYSSKCMRTFWNFLFKLQGHLEDHGPFSGLWKLVRNPAHLSVFLHYLMSNSNPSSLVSYSS